MIHEIRCSHLRALSPDFAVGSSSQDLEEMEAVEARLVPSTSRLTFACVGHS